MSTLQIVLLFGIVALANSGSLTDLYNSGVTYAEYYTRPLSSSSSGSGSGSSSDSGSSSGSSSGWWWRKKRSWNYNLHHSGVVVTTRDGQRWLIHKGEDYGDSWDTVITSASHMSSRWTRTKCGVVNGYTVDNFMKAARINCPYSVLKCNCQHASNGMWTLVSYDVSC